MRIFFDLQWSFETILHYVEEIKFLNYSGTKLNEAELIQYRWCKGGGPSGKTCPKWAPQVPHRTSVLTMPCVSSLYSYMFTSGYENAGHPQEDSNFCSEEKRGDPHTIQLYCPGSIWFQYSFVKGRSVPDCYVTSYYIGVSRLRSSSSDSRYTMSCVQSWSAEFAKTPTINNTNNISK